MGQEEQQHYLISSENYSNLKINRNFFDFQYIIGKGGFGKVTNNLYNIIILFNKGMESCLQNNREDLCNKGNVKSKNNR